MIRNLQKPPAPQQNRQTLEPLRPAESSIPSDYLEQRDNQLRMEMQGYHRYLEEGLKMQDQVLKGEYQTRK